MAGSVCHDEKRWIGRYSPSRRLFRARGADDVNARRPKAATLLASSSPRDESVRLADKRHCSIHLAPYQTILIIRDIRVIRGFCYSRGREFSL